MIHGRRLPATALAVLAVVTAGLTATGGAVAAPASLTELVDDTGTVAISVPSTWTDITTTPGIAPDRTVFPAIYASAPETGFPSVSVWVEPFREDAGITDIAWCSQRVEPYAAGEFTGQRAWFTECDGGLLYQDIVVEPSGQQFTVSVSYAYESAADEPLLDEIAATLKALATEYPPPSATGPIGCLRRCHEETAEEVADPSAVQPPGVVGPTDLLWVYGPFWNVPQLGTEPVRGSGCGSQGQIGDIIPDGLWAGYVTNEDTDLIDVDLLCIFAGEAAEHVLSEGTATIVHNEPDYLVVNNSTRLRSVPAASGIVLRDTMIVDGVCVEDTLSVHNPEPVRQAWIRIVDGLVTWILWGCGEEPAGPSAPATEPPAPAAETEPPPAPTGTRERISFAAGTSGASVSGGVVVGTTNHYLLEAAAGQTMAVQVTSVEDNARVAVYAPDGALLVADQVAATVSLPADGDYVIEVGSTRGNATYALDVSIA